MQLPCGRVGIIMKRYYGYKKKRSSLFTKLFIIILSFILCVGATILYGLHLRKKAEESQLLFPDTTADTTASQTTTEPVPTRKTARSVNAPPLFTRWPSTDDDLDAALSALSQSGHDAATVILRDKNGRPLYPSEIAAYSSNHDVSTGSADTDNGTEGPVELKTLVAKLHNAGIYICGYFESRMTDYPGYLSDFIYSYEMALIGELYKSGVDELVLDGLAPANSSMDWIDHIYNDINERYPELVVGITVSPEVITAESSSLLFHSLSEIVDFIVLDMTKIETKDYKDLLGSSSLFFSKYNMRALISAPDSQTLEERLLLLHDGAVQNYQVIAVDTFDTNE